MWDSMQTYHGGWGWFGFPVMLLFWGLLIFGFIMLVRYLAREHGTGRTDAIEILRARYARGEIDQQEYEERKKNLEKR